MRSEGDLVKSLLDTTIEISKRNPENEKKIYQSLESLLRHLQDIMYEKVVPTIESQNATKEISNVKRKSISNQSKEESKQFRHQLETITNRKLSLPNMVNIALKIGPKHGLFILRKERRSKVLIGLWFKAHFRVLEEDIRAMMNENGFNEP